MTNPVDPTLHNVNRYLAMYGIVLLDGASPGAVLVCDDAQGFAKWGGAGAVVSPDQLGNLAWDVVAEAAAVFKSTDANLTDPRMVDKRGNRIDFATDFDLMPELTLLSDAVVPEGSQIRLGVTVITNPTAPGADIVAKVKRVGVTGAGANMLRLTDAADLATATVATPAANSITGTVSANVPVPAASGTSHYVIALYTSGAIAAGAAVGIRALLQIATS